RTKQTHRRPRESWPAPRRRLSQRSRLRPRPHIGSPDGTNRLGNHDLPLPLRGRSLDPPARQAKIRPRHSPRHFRPVILFLNHHCVAFFLSVFSVLSALCVLGVKSSSAQKQNGAPPIARAAVSSVLGNVILVLVRHL